VSREQWERREWAESVCAELEYRTRIVRPMMYRCKTCGTMWAYDDSALHMAMWALHSEPHKRTDAIMAESIALNLGAF